MNKVFVTTSSDLGYIEYGYSKVFIDSFLEKTPYSLVYYYDSVVPSQRPNLVIKRLAHRSIQSIQRASEDFPVLRGRIGTNYNYRFNAAGFCHKVFAQLFEALLAFDPTTPTQLIWMDSDIEVLESMDGSALDKLSEYDIGYLGRKGWHTCTSFISYVLNDNTLQFLDRLSALYITGEFLLYPEWNDAYLFDVVRSEWPQLNYIDLGAPYDGAGPYNVFDLVFNGWMTHRKGLRKFKESSSRVSEGKRIEVIQKKEDL